MKIPESIRIAGTEYTVENVEFLNNGINLAYGHIDFEAGKIELSANSNIGYEHKCQTLLHEILHGVIHHTGLTIKDEEHVVDVLAKGLYQVLQDNGARLFDIRRGGKQ